MKLGVVLVLAALAASLTLPAYAPAQASGTNRQTAQLSATQEQESDGGPDILEMALITTAVAAGAAVLATCLYLVRRAIGFDLHRPPEGDEGGGEH